MTGKILVADDDMDNRAIVQKVLERAGFGVVLATNGEEAMQMVEREKPCLLLLDLSMPKMSGWEVARNLREKEEFKNLPIIAFTAHALTGDELQAKAAGCDDYLSKPCTPSEIISRVNKWIEHSE